MTLLAPPPERGAPIRIGFQAWGQSVSWASLMETAARIESLGFASLFANDHLMPILGDADGPVVGSQGPVFEGWMTLAGFTARTSSIALGVLVSAVPYRNVGVTVKMATALDHMSEGRAILGLGAGWHEPEHRAFGIEMPAIGERISRLDEAASVARAFLDGGTATLDGRWVRVDGARNDPPPVQRRLPLLIGGSGVKRTLRIVARDADIWNGEGDPRRYAELNAILDGHCRDVGRDPAAIRRTVGVSPCVIRDTRDGAVEALAGILERQVHPGDVASAARSRPSARSRAWAASSPLADTDEVVAGLLRGWHAAGAEEAIVDLPSPVDIETLERLAGPVSARLR